MEPLIPQPTSITPGTGTFRLTPEAVIHVSPGSPQSIQIANALADQLRPVTGYALPVQASGEPVPSGCLFHTFQGRGEDALNGFISA
jgi:hypothetical protein